MNKQPNQEFEEDYFTTTHNIEANEETKDLEKYYIQDAIGSTLFSKSWLLSTLSNLNTENILASKHTIQFKHRKF